MSGSLMMSRDDWKRSWPAWLRATFIGFPFGTIPAGGAEIPTFLSYALEKKLTKHPEEFGHGAIEGVAGPEAANNASSAGVLVPLLTLGIPTSATAAILLAAFQNYGVQPGPLLFQTQGALVWGLIASMYIGNMLLLILNLPLIGLWVKVLMIPRPLLYAGILVFATLGAYSLHQSVVDLTTLYVFGLLGFMMRRWGFPVAPAVIGLILGPLAESQFRRALAISQGDPSVFFTHPISASLLGADRRAGAGAVADPRRAVNGAAARRREERGCAPDPAALRRPGRGRCSVRVSLRLSWRWPAPGLPLDPHAAAMADRPAGRRRAGQHADMQPVAPPPGARQLGQWAIGVALGLYFSPRRRARSGAARALAAARQSSSRSRSAPSVLGCCARMTDTDDDDLVLRDGHRRRQRDGNAGAASRRPRRARGGRTQPAHHAGRADRAAFVQLLQVHGARSVYRRWRAASTRSASRCWSRSRWALQPRWNASGRRTAG